jgi:hypothetical protein
LRGDAYAQSGGRTWWAHFEFTRINIALTILENQIEEILNTTVVARLLAFANPTAPR